jgi:hypothetical protein
VAAIGIEELDVFGVVVRDALAVGACSLRQSASGDLWGRTCDRRVDERHAWKKDSKQRHLDPMVRGADCGVDMKKEVNGVCCAEAQKECNGI